MSPLSDAPSWRRRRSRRSTISARSQAVAQDVKSSRRPIPRQQRSHKGLAQVVRYALGGGELPSIFQTLPFAETARRYLMGIFGQMNVEPNGLAARSAVLSGKDAEGRPLKGHGHAYFLPTDEDGDGQIEYLTIVAENGFDERERRALERFDGVLFNMRSRRAQRLDLALIGMGNLVDYQPAPIRASRHWLSATPFIVTRHRKSRGRKRDPRELLQRDNHAAFVQKVLEEELDRWRERRPDAPSPVRISPLFGEHGRMVVGTEAVPPLRFVRRRRKRDDDGGRRLAGGFHIEFSQPVRGPIALGWSSHFGMGLFVPRDQE